MNALTPLAVANADVLRILHTAAPGSVADLARQVSRDKDNLRKTLKALSSANLLSDRAPVPGLTAAGLAALEAIQRARIRRSQAGRPASLS
jgi:DNA-binding MarR family transcriptional regulator